MASHTASRVQTFTTTGTATEDTVTLGAGYRFVEVLNHSTTAAEKINFSVDGTSTATTPPDDTEIVLASSSLIVRTATEAAAPVVKVRPLSGTPMVTVKGIA